MGPYQVVGLWQVMRQFVVDLGQQVPEYLVQLVHRASAEMVSPLGLDDVWEMREDRLRRFAQVIGRPHDPAAQGHVPPADNPRVLAAEMSFGDPWASTKVLQRDALRRHETQHVRPGRPRGSRLVLDADAYLSQDVSAPTFVPC